MSQEESLVDKWAEEFTGKADKAQLLESEMDFWDKLQRQWEELAQ